VTSHAAAERAALCALLGDLGPAAPTLCEGWVTYDLAAHLAVRDRNYLAAPGYVLSSLADHTARIEKEYRAAHPYAEVVDTVRSGPPAWGPVGVPIVRESANLLEYLIHHEDVRRAQPGWEPREVPAELANAVWSRLRTVGRMMFRKASVGVRMQRAGEEERPPVRVRSGSPEVTVVGEPIELALFAFNRRDVARTTFEGDADAINRLRLSTLGP
jgi:uncharacterized protein (TIGR03085 family)